MLEFVFVGLVVRIGCASGADGAAAFVYHFFPDKFGALFSTLSIGGAEDHAVAQVQHQDIRLVLAGVSGQQRQVTLSKGDQSDIGFSDFTGDSVVTHTADRRSDHVLELFADQDEEVLRPELWRLTRFEITSAQAWLI